jgi:hypothetical protein
MAKKKGKSNGSDRKGIIAAAKDLVTTLGLKDWDGGNPIPTSRNDRASDIKARVIEAAGLIEADDLGDFEDETLATLKALGVELPEGDASEPEEDPEPLKEDPEPLKEDPEPLKEEKKGSGKADKPKKKPKPPKKPRYSRIDSFAEAFQACLKKGTASKKAVAEKSNELYMEHGGTNNANVGTWVTTNAVKVLVSMGFATVDGDTITYPVE